jgi:hypothetical protein
VTAIEMMVESITRPMCVRRCASKYGKPMSLTRSAANERRRNRHGRGGDARRQTSGTSCWFRGVSIGDRTTGVEARGEERRRKRYSRSGGVACGRKTRGLFLFHTPRRAVRAKGR